MFSFAQICHCQSSSLIRSGSRLVMASFAQMGIVFYVGPWLHSAPDRWCFPVSGFCFRCSSLIRFGCPLLMSCRVHSCGVFSSAVWSDLAPDFRRLFMRSGVLFPLRQFDQIRLVIADVFLCSGLWSFACNSLIRFGLQLLMGSFVQIWLIFGEAGWLHSAPGCWCLRCPDLFYFKFSSLIGFGSQFLMAFV